MRGRLNPANRPELGRHAILYVFDGKSQLDVALWDKLSDVPLGYILVIQGQVEVAAAIRGWGPFLYDSCAALLRGYGTPLRASVVQSKYAQRLWGGKKVWAPLDAFEQKWGVPLSSLVAEMTSHQLTRAEDLFAALYHRSTLPSPEIKSGACVVQHGLYEDGAYVVLNISPMPRVFFRPKGGVWHYLDVDDVECTLDSGQMSPADAVFLEDHALYGVRKDLSWAQLQALAYSYWSRD